VLDEVGPPGEVHDRRAAGLAEVAVAGEQADTIEVSPVRSYSPVLSLLPRYWIPFIGSGAGSGTGTFYGASTSGADLVGRHAYSLAAGYQPVDRLFQGEARYSYAGLGRVILGIGAGRSWEGALIDLQDAQIARLLSRDDEITLSATLRRQRYRSAAQLTVAAEGVSRKRMLRDVEGIGLIDPEDRLAGAVLQLGFSNYRAQPFSISPEDGISFSATGRRRWEIGADPGSGGRGYDEVSGQFVSYKALGLPGFSNHVLALRTSARWRQGPGAYPVGVGGASGSPLDLGIATVGSGYHLLPVRGFPENERYGTRAWSTSLEYRFPLAQLNRGVGLWPVFLDRLSGAFFLDAGNAWCGAAERARLAFCSDDDARAIVAAGTELALGAAFFAVPARIRGGIAWPVQGRSGRPELYLRMGLPF
jgi:hypothetical protein